MPKIISLAQPMQRKLHSALAGCASLVALALSSCTTTQLASVPAPAPASPPVAAAEAGPPALSIPGYVSTGRTESGEASWYNTRCNGGTRTASGEPLRNDAMTAAHKTLPMGTLVKVTNLRNGHHAVVRITDRSPYTKGRVIDVTEGVARRLDFVQRGVAPVRLTVVERAQDTGPQATSPALASSSSDARPDEG